MAVKYRTGTDPSITGRNTLKSAIMGLYFALARIRSCVTVTAFALTAKSPAEFNAQSRVRYTRVLASVHGGEGALLSVVRC